MRRRLEMRVTEQHLDGAQSPGLGSEISAATPSPRGDTVRRENGAAAVRFDEGVTRVSAC